MKSRNRIQTLLGKYTRRTNNLVGHLGNHENVIPVSGRNGYVYVTLSSGDVVEAYNDIAPRVLNLEVTLGYSEEEKHILRVLGSRSTAGRYGETKASRSTSLKEHHKSHEWMNADGGNDVVFSDLRQFMPFRPTPIGGMQLHVYRGISWLGGEWTYTSGTSIDLSAYIPDTSGIAQYALVYVDSLGNPDFIIGSGSAQTWPTLGLSDIPEPYPGTLPVAAVRMYHDQSGIIESRNATDLIDLRFPGWSEASSTTDLSGALLQNGTTELTDDWIAGQYRITVDKFTVGTGGDYLSLETGILLLLEDGTHLHLEGRKTFDVDNDTGKVVIIGQSENMTEWRPSNGTLSYVDENGVFRGSAIINRSVVYETTTYTVLSTDDMIVCNSTGSFPVNMIASTGNGKAYTIKNINTGIVTVTPDGSDTIDGETEQLLNQWDSVDLVDSLVGTWVII